MPKEERCCRVDLTKTELVRLRRFLQGEINRLEARGEILRLERSASQEIALNIVRLKRLLVRIHEAV